MTHRTATLVALTLALSAGPARSAEPMLAGAFGDHMVLQRGERTAIWGTGDAGAAVSVFFHRLELGATVGDDGRFRVELDTSDLPPGPHRLHVRVGEQWVSHEDVLVGDVWVASGQSNMEWPVGASANAPDEIAAADFPQVRQYTVPKRVSNTPLDDVDGTWEVCSPATVGAFSAVGYFFARHVHQQTGVPIGIIHTSWGGTPAEAWTSDAVLAGKFPEFVPRIAARDRAAQDEPAQQERYRAELEAWEAKHVPRDEVNLGVEHGWAKPETDVGDWPMMDLPRNWERAGLRIDGAVWFRRDVDVPAEWVGKPLALHLGPIDDFDVTYFNGVKVGQTDASTAQYWLAPRVYAVPGDRVQQGRATIAVRVFDHGGGGGLHGEPQHLKLTGDGLPELPLAGDWHYKVEREIEPPTPEALASRPEPPKYNQNSPGVLFNAMIHPIVGYGMRGAIWYQGESNAGRAYQYRDLFPAMIADWRARWGAGDFPFYYVQLANFMPRHPEPGESAWAELREAQLLTLHQSNTAMAVTIDIGEADDIHPRNKQGVGKRLALAAMKHVYGKEVAWSGPVYASMAVDQSRVRVHFTHTDGGLQTSDGRPPVGFAIAGEDKRFVWANTQIEGDSILVHSGEVPSPVAVRYGWADNPDANLTSGAGLPASPFRTDDWPGVTVNNR